jgi:regulatory protein
MKGRDAVAAALRSLTRRDMSEMELRHKLKNRGYADCQIDDAVSRMKGYGYLDDGRYARQWAESALRCGRRFGPRLKMELAARGIAEDVISEVVDSLADEFPEPELVAAIVAKRFGGIDFSNPDPGEKRRVVAYLQRRGFSLPVILKVLDRQ